MRQPIRVLLVDMPRIPRELIERAVAAEPDMLVVGSTPELAELPSKARETDPDFVIVGLVDQQLPPECESFLDRQARVRVLGVEANDGSASLYVLRPHRAELGEVSPADLIAAIRAAAEAEE